MAKPHITVRDLTMAYGDFLIQQNLSSVFLDPETKTMLATGAPKHLLAESADPKIIQFLTRGELVPNSVPLRGRKVYE